MTRIATCLVVLEFALQISFISVVHADDATGSAAVQIDGESFTYLLLTGFDVDTDFSNPRRSIVVFAISDWDEGTNPRRVRLSIDATRLGRFSTNDEGVRFKFIEDGGQHFDPSGGCDVEITSAYTGAADSVYSGRVSNCVVNSLAAERRVSVDFTMRGVPSPY